MFSMWMITTNTLYKYLLHYTIALREITTAPRRDFGGVLRFASAVLSVDFGIVRKSEDKIDRNIIIL